MKEIKHTAFGGSDICIYEHTQTKIRGSFFGKEKPEVGDLIETAFHKGNYEVVSIIENRDACISLDCNKNPEKALFILEIRKC